MIYIIVLILACISEIIIARGYLKILQKKKIIQPLLKDGPDHQKKVGTPTMGGVSFDANIIIYSFIILLFMLINGKSISMLIVFLLVFIGYAFIGYKDDILKVIKKENTSGLSPKQKLILQLILAILIFIFLLISNYNLSINLFVFNWSIDAASVVVQAIIYFVFILLLLAGMSNATNLTDGLDGLLSSTYILGLIPLEVIAAIQSQYTVVLIISITIGSLIGFLFFNKYPAKMFMGDTGSLALGALFVLLSIALKVEALILIIGLIYILETISVMLQVAYFKYTKRKFGAGKRIFLMAPYHHHLERKGFSEKQIVLAFSIVQIILSIVALAIYV